MRGRSCRPRGDGPPDSINVRRGLLRRGVDRQPGFDPVLDHPDRHAHGASLRGRDTHAPEHAHVPADDARAQAHADREATTAEQGADALKAEARRESLIKQAGYQAVYCGQKAYNGVATLTITTNDLGHTGSGGAMSDTDTLSITGEGSTGGPRPVRRLR